MVYPAGTREWRAAPSNTPVQTAATARAIDSATNSAAKSKEIAITFPGVYRIKFGLTAPTGGGAAAYSVGQIYRNGVAVGTLRTTAPGAATTKHEFTEDIGGWEANDLCQLYVHNVGGAAAGDVFGFVIFADYAQMPPQIPAGAVQTDTAV